MQAGADPGGGQGWPWPPQMEGWPPLWLPHLDFRTINYFCLYFDPIYMSR